MKQRKREAERERQRRIREAVERLKETGGGNSSPPSSKDPKEYIEEEKKRKREYAQKQRIAEQEATEGGGDSSKLTEEDWKLIEKRRRKNEQVRLRRERLKKEDPEKFSEIEKQKRFQTFVRKASMTEEELKEYKLKRYLYRQVRESRVGKSKDQPVEWKEKRRLKSLERRRNPSGEKKKRYQDSVRRAQQKRMERLKADGGEKWKELREKQNAYLREKYANETPEERERRKWKEKVNAARRRLKKKLEEEGWDKEEIERRDMELKVRMWKEFDPEGEVPSSKPGNRRKKPQQQPVQSPDPSPSFIGAKEEINIYPGFGGDDDYITYAPPSPCSSPIPPSPSPLSPDTTSFPDPRGTQSSLSPVASTPCSRSQPSTENFTCPHCSATFENDAECRIHIQLIHPSKCWKCPKCSELVLSPVELIQHYNATHMKPTQRPEKEELSFQCMRCPHSSLSVREPVTFKFKSRLELFFHVKTSHPGSYWPCLDCHLLKYSEQSLQVHLSVCGPHNANKKRRS